MLDGTSHEAAPGAEAAVAELARDDVARKKFLKMAGRGIGSAAAASGLAAFITAGATTATASAAAPTSDLAIVNYALTLEYLESQFYAKVVASKLFSGKTLDTLKVFGQEETAHVAALLAVAKMLGTPAAKPTGKFPLKSAASVAKLAATVENLGASAYLGQAPLIKSKEILAAALAIHSIEARHAATLNLLLKMDPTPTGAFAKPATMSQVLAAVKPFIA